MPVLYAPGKGRPDQRPSHRPRRTTPPPPPYGAGSELKSLLARIGIVATAGCNCNLMAWKMDAHGVAWSREHLEEIVDVMQKTAKDRKLPFVRFGAEQLVKLAISRAEKRIAREAATAPPAP